ncbi:MAG: DUF4124 domain-containing protein [Comamonas sp.]
MAAQDIRWVATAALALGMAATGMAQPKPGATATVYACVDAQGRHLTADRPIAACADREQQVISPTGAVRTIGPNTSEYERAEQAARQRREAEERSRAGEGKRRERALAARYPSKAVHDAERSANLVLLQEQARTVQVRKRIIESERAKLDEEMEFYRKDPAKAPASLRERVGANTQDQQEADKQTAVLADETRRVNERFDAEAQVLKPYWAAPK